MKRGMGSAAPVLSLLTVVLSGLSACADRYLPDEGLFARMQTDRGEMVFALKENSSSVYLFIDLAEQVKADAPMRITEAHPGEYLVVQPAAVPPGLMPYETGVPSNFNSAGQPAFTRYGDDLTDSSLIITLNSAHRFDNFYTDFGRIIHGDEVLGKLRPGDRIKSIELIYRGRFNPEDYAPPRRREKLAEQRQFNADYAEEQLKSRWPELTGERDELRSVIIGEGSGPKPRPGDRITFHYTASFIDRTIIYSSLLNDRAYTVTVDEETGFPALDNYLPLMLAEEKRVIISPARFAAKTIGNITVAPHRMIILVVEVVNIERAAGDAEEPGE